MKKLLDAFLELPTSTGLLLIVAFVVLELALCLWLSYRAYFAGRRDSEDLVIAHLDKKQRELGIL